MRPGRRTGRKITGSAERATGVSDATAQGPPAGVDPRRRGPTRAGPTGTTWSAPDRDRLPRLRTPGRPPYTPAPVRGARARAVCPKPGPRCERGPSGQAYQGRRRRLDIAVSFFMGAAASRFRSLADSHHAATGW